MSDHDHDTLSARVARLERRAALGDRAVDLLGDAVYELERLFRNHRLTGDDDVTSRVTNALRVEHARLVREMTEAGRCAG